MRRIDDLFMSEANVPLYHYTGIGSLMGMANTECIWASSISYMNDSKEMVHACDTVSNVLRARLAFGKEDEEKRFLTQFQSWTNHCKGTAHTLFVFSLSEKSSLLSQWRSYTPHGKGVSIGFSPEKLNFIMQSSNLRLARCVYERVEQEEVISSLIEKLLISFRQELPYIDTTRSHPDQCYWGFINQHKCEIFQVMSIIKHGAFSEEREWRLISQHYEKYTVPQIKFREGASMVIPYIEIPLGANKPYFEDVILGPTQHNNLSMSGLTMFLSNRGLCGTVLSSGIPYREWQ